VLVSDRGAEECHDAVARVLVDRPFVAVDTVREDPEKTIEEAMPFLGIDTLGELHRVRDIGKQDGDRLALALECALGGEDLLDEMARGVRPRLRSGCRRPEGRAARIAELGSGRVVSSARQAAHGVLPILARPDRRYPWPNGGLG